MIPAIPTTGGTDVRPSGDGARLPGLVADAWTDAQREVANKLARSRGGTVSGPFNVWLRNPALAAAAGELGDALRLRGALDRRLFELAILVTARHWRATYPWLVHCRDAQGAGLAAVVIESVRRKQRPLSARDDEFMVIDVVHEVLDSGTLGEVTYRRALGLLGEAALIELVTVCGFYTTAAFVANVFDVAVPDDAQPFGEAPVAFDPTSGASGGS